MLKINKRLRKLKSKTSLYLDYKYNGQRIQQPTGLFYLHGKDNHTKAHNTKADLLFEKLRAEKVTELYNGSNNYLPCERINSDFIEYYKKYEENHKTKSRKLSACLKHFVAFTNGKQVKFSQITEDLLLDFKKYLESRVNGETPHGYFKALSRVLAKAKKDKYLLENPALDIRVSRKAINVKNTLSLNEIETLKNTHCSNNNVKTAFLFACCTGIRFGDIKNLKWENVSTTKFPVITITQNKTNKLVKIPLNANAISLLGTSNKIGKIFNLPTNNGTNKVLSIWVKNAGINKKITFHCSRHSFATNVLIKTNDLFSTSQLLGHTSIKETQKYVRAIDSKLLEAVQSINF